MGKGFEAFKFVYEIAENSSALYDRDHKMYNFLHDLCSSIKRLRMLYHPIFRFVLQHAGKFNHLWTMKGGRPRKSAIELLGAKEESGKFRRDDKAQEGVSVYRVDLFSKIENVLPEKLDLMYYDPEINSLVFRILSSSSETDEEE